MLFSADGIWSKLLSNPWWAGYTSVLVSCNDIYAMGGEPIAMVNILSCSDKGTYLEIGRGIADATKKLGIPMVGGHIHPDTPYTSLSVAIIGKVERGCEIRSNMARNGDSVVFAYDLAGQLGPNSPYSFESTSSKGREELKRIYSSMRTLATSHLLSGGKDISNAGTIGTLGMLCEASGVGAVVDVDELPIPEGIPLSHWLLVHPATGFVVTCSPDKTEEVVSIFENSGMVAALAGKIVKEKTVTLMREDEKAVALDLTNNGVMGTQRE